MLGSSLGALTLNQDMGKTNSKFGEMIGDGGARSEHIAFGFDNKVLELKRTRVYT